MLLLEWLHEQYFYKSRRLDKTTIIMAKEWGKWETIHLEQPSVCECKYWCEFVCRHSVVWNGTLLQHWYVLSVLLCIKSTNFKFFKGLKFAQTDFLYVHAFHAYFPCNESGLRFFHCQVLKNTKHRKRQDSPLTWLKFWS